MRFAFRLATAADLPALKTLVESAYRGDSARLGWTHEADLLFGERVSMADLALAVGDADARVILCDVAGLLHGTVTITARAGDRAYLGMLCVDPRRQAGGLGRALIAEAEAVARRTFASTVMEMTVIAPRRDLIAYYIRRGYRETGERRPFPMATPVAFDMVVLERAIA